MVLSKCKSDVCTNLLVNLSGLKVTESMIEQFKQVGVGAILPGELPLQSIVSVGDALLAVPITAVEVQLGVNSNAIIQDLRQRARDNMWVGAGGISTIAEVDAAIAAGAHFVMAVSLRPSLINYCRQRGVPVIPSVISLTMLDSKAERLSQPGFARTGAIIQMFDN